MDPRSFSRGETQALATVTLGTSREANQIDMPSFEGEERFYLHYNFPPFSTGEARPLRGTSRKRSRSRKSSSKST